jgi:hypothetical protein
MAATPPPARAANGCGPGGFGFLVPDRPLGFDFRPACDRHDLCYTAPWRQVAPARSAAKLRCDATFLVDLERACFAAAAGRDAGPRLVVCLSLARDYHNAVRGWLGELAYGQAQR